MGWFSDKDWYTYLWDPVNIGGNVSGAINEAAGSDIMPFASGMYGGGSDGSPGFSWGNLINEYGYQPKYTGQIEKGLFDLFQSMTGLGGGGVGAIPFDIGLPTTGLYDSLTRGIKEDYLGTPGGPEGGRIADSRSYYNQLGIPEQAINQERLANRDLNNLLLDQAALINESQKDRLLNVLNSGAGIGQNTYAQNLAQHRANIGFGFQGVGMDMGLQEAIRQANQSSLNSLLGAAGTAAGAYFGGPAGAAVGGNLGNLAGTYVNKQGSLGNPYSVKGAGQFYGSANDPTAKLL